MEAATHVQADTGLIMQASKRLVSSLMSGREAATDTSGHDHKIICGRASVNREGPDECSIVDVLISAMVGTEAATSRDRASLILHGRN
jgi:hypothetical protein